MVSEARRCANCGAVMEFAAVSRRRFCRRRCRREALAARAAWLAEVAQKERSRLAIVAARRARRLAAAYWPPAAIPASGGGLPLARQPGGGGAGAVSVSPGRQQFAAALAARERLPWS